MTTELEVSIAVLKEKMSALNEQFDAMEESLGEKLDALTRRVEEQDALVQRGKGILIALGLLGSALMAIPQYLNSLMKIGH